MFHFLFEKTVTGRNWGGGGFLFFFSVRRFWRKMRSRPNLIFSESMSRYGLLLVVFLMCYRFINRAAPPSAALWTTEGSVPLNLQEVPSDSFKSTPLERRFNPYDFNGG